MQRASLPPDVMAIEALADRLQQHVIRLADNIGERNVFHPSALWEAEHYINREWEQQGYQVIAQNYLAKDVRSANLEVSYHGSSQPEKIILLGAHYDSVIGSPGANDNASGVAALLELSRLFIATPPRLTVRFVAFVNEEPPQFFTRNQGSMVYSREAHRRGDDIRLMVSLETIGCYHDEPNSQQYPPLFRFFYPDKADFVAFVSNFRSRAMLRRLVNAFRASTDFPLQSIATFALIPGVAWSDHLSFWRMGYRALMVTDTAFYRYPWYHTAQDTPEKLDYTRLAQVTMGLHKAIRLLAEELV